MLMGTFAEYLPVWAPALVKIPDSLSDREAPLACGGLTA
jgi:D-arabinose 1-dehydrogenase-like Zn-dependent alcohol dehydrogenase